MSNCPKGLTWFLIFILIVHIIALGILIANIVYFSDLSGGGTLSEMTSSSMIWISVVAGIAVLGVLIWGIFWLVVCNRKGYNIKEDMSTSAERMARESGQYVGRKMGEYGDALYSASS
jgi:uncharacterized membrane protein YciS (DUF1049 family)